MLRALLVLCVVIAASLAGIARAEDVLVVAVGGNATEVQRAPVLDAVAARFTADGFVVLGSAELVHRLPPSRLTIATTEDAARVSAELGIPRVAIVSVWVSGDAITELSLSLHALSGARSARHATASGTLDAEHDARAIVDTMVAQVLYAERSAAMMDPGAGTTTTVDPEGDDPEAERPPSEGLRATLPPATGGTSTSGRSGDGPEPLFGIVGPGLLAAIGAAGIGLGVWATLDPTCDRYNADRTICLRGEQNNPGVGITMILVGSLSLAGAIAWWVLDAEAPENEPRIDVVIGPGSAGVRGTF
ncbi:MAG: hypothetical protein J0L92_23110 [Deltaproteobacteria bacterium]|nr:hypothetical protein [Deltaproteobacteria bacterium]